MTQSRMLTMTLFILLGLFIAIQWVPYGHDHVPPADGTLVTWDSPATEALAKRACFDCHSNRTAWPWYASIAPISWRIQTHVNRGRKDLNFTAFDPASKDVAEAAGEAGGTVTRGEMPPNDYLLAHPEARLTATEKRALVAGLDRTFVDFTGRRAKNTLSGAIGSSEGAERGERGEAKGK